SSTVLSSISSSAGALASRLLSSRPSRRASKCSTSARNCSTLMSTASGLLYRPKTSGCACRPSMWSFSTISDSRSRTVLRPWGLRMRDSFMPPPYRFGATYCTTLSGPGGIGLRIRSCQPQRIDVGHQRLLQLRTWDLGVFNSASGLITGQHPPYPVGHLLRQRDNLVGAPPGLPCARGGGPSLLLLPQQSQRRNSHQRTAQPCRFFDRAHEAGDMSGVN